ncbi:hypothetical protein ElyMa_003565400 [Elysia marginata]|uniref:Uncharacterized protein n=1 Tax=Elysia marginata TaxID=1093978 RepID=A0AAV4ENF3_9GAST|nr:hypothetical protein ElyMa_003565400 [Elysia marginata]
MGNLLFYFNVKNKFPFLTKVVGFLSEGQRGGVVSASDSRSGGRGFDSRPCHVAIALGKQSALTFPSPPTCKIGTQLQASNVLVCCGISGAALWRHSYDE